MLRRIRKRRALLALGGLPAGLLQAGLLVVSVFLHPAGDADAGAVAVHSDSRLHDFHLAAEAGGDLSLLAPCLGCALERSPAAVPLSRPTLDRVVPFAGAPAEAPTLRAPSGRPRSGSPRAPPSA